MRGVTVGVESNHVTGQGLPKIRGGDEVDAVVAIPASRWHGQIAERGKPGLCRSISEIHGEGEAISQQHVAAAG
ncbi:hypothetical protein D3C84_1092880 [compost metagenome]